jgi:hypothetical protein
MTYRVDFFKHTRKKGRVNRKTTNYGDHKYDSMAEAKYAEDLDWRLKAGEIKAWSPHPNLHFYFIDPVTGDRIHLFDYKIDFMVEYHNGTIEYVEFKSSWTSTFQEFRFKWSIVDKLWKYSDYAECEKKIVIG